MKPSYFQHYGLSQAKRKTLNVSSFYGLDLNNQKFNIADGRAIDLLNYVWKDGVVQKRNGFEEIYKVKGNNLFYISKDNLSEYKVNESNFNAIWRFEAEDGEIHIVAHIGKLLYEVKSIESENVEIEAITTTSKKQIQGVYYPVCYEFENYKSSGFVAGNKLWFLGGNKYMCLRFLSGNQVVFEPVENSDLTPIPTTSISIVYKNSIASGNAMTLDRVNLLTMWRKNILTSGTTKSEDSNTKTLDYEYSLDSALICEDEGRDMANFEMTIEERGTIE